MPTPTLPLFLAIISALEISYCFRAVHARLPTSQILPAPASTGQHRYLGVDVFSKKLQEGTSFIHNPASSVPVQAMLGPAFAQYKIIRIRNRAVHVVIPSGEVKDYLPVFDQSALYSRLFSANRKDPGSVWAIVLVHHAHELVVDYQIIVNNEDMTLHMAAHDGIIVHTLLENGASPTVQIDRDVVRLLSAAAMGKVDEV